MNSLVWMTVPGGRADSATLRLAVVIVPQLTCPTLADAGLAQWPPEALATGTLVAEFAAGPDATLLGSVRLRLAGVADPALWTQFFPAAMRIDPPAARQHAGRPLHVRQASADAASSERIYHDVMTVANQPGIDAGGVQAALSTALATHALAAPDAAPPDVERLAAAPPDFHGVYGLLREHPCVMRALGLVLDLEGDAPPAVLAATTGVARVAWRDAPAGLPAIASPWSAYELGAGLFLPKSTHAISRGMVTVTEGAPPAAQDNAAEWCTLTIDIEASAARLRDAATAANPRLPPIKSGGFALAQRSIGAALQRHRERNGAREDVAAGAPLDADDLLLGYRVDIKRGSDDQWRSLMLRHTAYHVAGNVPVGVAEGAVEEAHLKHGSAFDHGDGVLHRDDLVARWTGWSLAVPQPRLDGQATGTETNAASPVAGFGFRMSTVAGSLPKLRFGDVYQMRLRAADVAGGGLGLDDPSADRCITAAVAFGRYEAVSAPRVALPDGVEIKTLAPGDSVLDVVLRSDAGQSPDEFAAANPRYAPHLRRVLQAPTVALEMAERHGQFDDLGEGPAAADLRWARVRPALRPDADGAPLLPDPAAGGVASWLPPTSQSVALLRADNWPAWPARPDKGVSVVSAPRDTTPGLAWAGDELTVAVPQGSEVALQLSSTLDHRYPSHFAARQAGQGGPGSELTGRHPLLTPPMTLRLTHAVRRPLATPTGALVPDRSAGATDAVLRPDPPLLGLHLASTAQLEVVASWREPADDQQRVVDAARVQSMRVDPADAAFGQPIRHNFGDTRHRRVAYTLTAVSRFRGLFLADEPSEAFLSSNTLTLVDVPSTARPPPAVVNGVTPAFAWTEQRTPNDVDRVRTCRLRVSLARPWFVSGEGEALAVILALPGAAPFEGTTSRIGRDSIWATASPLPALTPEHFSLASGPAVTVRIGDTGQNVLAVPHAVWFDAAQQCWCADIALPALADASYAPQVQLVVARYQAQSLSGYELSAVTCCDFAPLLPVRRLHVHRDNMSLVASLEGVGPAGPATNSVTFVVEETDAETLAADAPSLPAGAAAPGAWAWTAEGGESLNNLWGFPLAGTRACRLRVRETEALAPSLGHQAQPDELDEHAVFVDAVVLPPIPTPAG